MLRFVSAFAFAVLAAGSALAQPARPANWVAMPANDNGAQMWLDTNNVVTHSNGYYRVVPIRFQAPGEPQLNAFIEADCPRWGTRFVDRVDRWPSGAPNPVPAGEWSFVPRDTPLISGYILRAVCGG